MTTRSNFSIKSLAAAVPIVLLSACTPAGFAPVQADLVAVNKGPIASERPSCEVDTVDYELNAHVVSFQMTDGGGVSFGFDLFSGLLRALGLSFQVQGGQMDAAMELTTPLQPSAPIVESVGSASFSKKEFSFRLDAGNLSAGANYFSKTPVAKLSRAALNSTFTSVSTKLSEVQMPWSTRVITVPTDRDVVIPAGKLAGLAIGDRFNIFNVEHIWKGSPCASEYVMGRKLTREPVAVGTVTQIEINAAVVTLDIINLESAIEPGATVEISELAENSDRSPRRALTRSIRIGSISSGKLLVDGIGEIDIRNYMDSLIRPTVSESGFVVRK